MQWIVNRLRGELRVVARGPFPERLMNVCAQNGISFWALEWRDGHTLSMTVRQEDRKQLWKLAERDGRIICIERPLMYYRVHEEATTKACIKDNSRAREEAEMFAKMWPKPVVKLLMHYYRRAYEEYE